MSVYTEVGWGGGDGGLEGWAEVFRKKFFVS